MRPVQFSPEGYKDFINWAEHDYEIFIRINELIKDIDRNLFKGIGKPEPLKGKLQGFWSRRITGEHRLIYRIENNLIYIVSCEGHYSDK